MVDVGSFTGPLGGVIAIAWGAGAVSGYAFCLRTMYKLIKSQAEKDEKECEERLHDAKREMEGLLRRYDEKQRVIDALQERLLNGMTRQAAQIADSAVYLVDKGRVEKTYDSEDNKEK